VDLPGKSIKELDRLQSSMDELKRADHSIAGAVIMLPTSLSRQARLLRISQAAGAFSRPCGSRIDAGRAAARGRPDNCRHPRWRSSCHERVPSSRREPPWLHSRRAGGVAGAALQLPEIQWRSIRGKGHTPGRHSRAPLRPAPRQTVDRTPSWRRRSRGRVAPESDRRGLLKSLMTWAIPASLLTIRVFWYSALFVSLRLISGYCGAFANTLITPATPPPAPKKSSHFRDSW